MSIERDLLKECLHTCMCHHDYAIKKKILAELAKPEPEPDAYLTVDSTGKHHVHLGKMSDSTMQDWNIKYQYKLNISPPAHEPLPGQAIVECLPDLLKPIFFWT
jgi:hypothetical protein